MKIPGYTIIRELGQGGMATVYLARQDSLARDVALKVMKPLAMAGDDFTTRFVKEARIIAQLAHPQIITVYDFGTADGYHYFSMEYLPGGTLADEIKRGLSVGQAIAITRKIAEALAVAHARGVIHRDVKPQNILFRTDGTPVLTDFGIARAVTRDSESMQLTRYGMVVGSPRYMSPEQSLGQPLDPRSDLYSLGVLFYELLTQRLPYEADDVVSLAMKHCQDPIPRLPEPLAVYQQILDRLIAKKPEDRFASAGQLIRALEALEGAHGESYDATRLIQRHEEAIQAPTPEPHLEPKPEPESTPRPRRSVPWRLILAFAIVLASGLGVYLGLRPPPAGPDTDPTGIIAQLPPAPHERPATATQYEALAIDHYRRGQIEQVQEIIRLALAATPDDARLLALRGLIERGIAVGQRLDEAQRALAENRIEAASQAVEEGLHLDPSHAELLSLRTRIQERLATRRRFEAERRLKTAREAQQRGDLDGAERLVREGLALVADHPDLLALLETIAQARQRRTRLERIQEQAIVRYDQGDYPGAFALIDEGLALAPGQPGLTALREKVIATLVREARQYMARVADERVDSIKALLGRYRLDAAAAHLEQLRALAPDDARLADLSAELERRRAFFPVMIEIPAGCFEMGSPVDEAGRESDERPHRVCVESFRLAPHEVTVAQFKRFVAASGYRTQAETDTSDSRGCESFDRNDHTNPWGLKHWASWRQPNQYQPNDDQHPVSCVSWNDVQAYIRWLNKETGHSFRLPTEAEWEYAARAGTSSARFWDTTANASPCRNANAADQGRGWDFGFDCDDGYEWVAPVGRFAPNAWGLYDMLGNVWEWTCSEYDADYQGVERLCAPPEIDLPRVMRGGAWNSGPALVRAAYRNRNFPETRYAFVGFRLALDLSDD